MKVYVTAFIKIIRKNSLLNSHEKIYIKLLKMYKEKLHLMSTQQTSVDKLSSLLCVIFFNFVAITCFSSCSMFQYSYDFVFFSSTRPGIFAMSFLFFFFKHIVVNMHFVLTRERERKKLCVLNRKLSMDKEPSLQWQLGKYEKPTKGHLRWI